MNNNLDHLFKKALQDKSCEPPPYIWGNIERQLNKNKHKVALWWWRTAAAVVAAFIGIWLFYSVESPEIEVAGITGTEILKTKDSTNLPDTFSDSIQEEKTVQYVTKETVTEVPVLIAQNKRTELEPIQMHRAGEAGFIEQTAPDYAISTRKLQRNFIPLTSKEAYQNQKEYQKLLNTPTSLTTDEKRKIKVMVSGHFVPAYSSGSYSSSLKNSRGVSYSSNQMDGLMNVGGGLKLSVSANKRFSVQTGLFYSRMGQKTSGAGSGVRAMMLPSLQHSDRMIATPLGNIKTRTQGVAYRSPEAILLSSLNSSSSETIEQTFGTLEIPLHVRYLLNNNKVLFAVSGGVSGNFIVNNKVFLRNGRDKEYIGSTEDIRNFNISTDIGLGMEYPVTSNIRIMIEPGFKYFLQSLSRNDDIDFKPYLFTFSTGIGIRF
jgi:hypothetical protein